MKDYAKPQRSTKPPRRKTPWISAMIIILAIALPIFMYSVRFQKTVNNASTVQSIKLAPITTKAHKKKAKKNNPEFDFYTILPKRKT